MSASEISKVLAGGVSARRSSNFVVDHLSEMLGVEGEGDEHRPGCRWSRVKDKVMQGAGWRGGITRVGAMLGLLSLLMADCIIGDSSS